MSQLSEKINSGKAKLSFRLVKKTFFNLPHS